DRGLAKFFDHLDKELGKGNYLVFLTADHGVADVLNYLKSQYVPAGSLDSRFLRTQLKGFTNQHYGEGNWIHSFTNEEIFLNRELAKEKGIDLTEMQLAIADFLLKFDGIKETYIANDMKRLEYTFGRKKLLQMGFNHKS